MTSAKPFEPQRELAERAVRTPQHLFFGIDVGLRVVRIVYLNPLEVGRPHIVDIPFAGVKQVAGAILAHDGTAEQQALQVGVQGRPT